MSSEQDESRTDQVAAALEAIHERLASGPGDSGDAPSLAGLDAEELLRVMQLQERLMQLEQIRVSDKQGPNGSAADLSGEQRWADSQAVQNDHFADSSDSRGNASSVHECERRDDAPPDVTQQDESRIPKGSSRGQIGRFEVLRVLGRGGQGLMLLAHDPVLDRRVALKVPWAETLIDPQLRRRFLREAQAAARLTHPHIVPVYEVGELNPICFIASAFVEGVSLAEWLKSQKQLLSPREAARIVSDLADAVQYAHSQGVLHRDLKPGNVILEPRSVGAAGDAPATSPWVAKLTDFGLAKILDAVSDETRSGAMIGTPAYMSPEQAKADHAHVGPASDVYALGAILYELLTGQAPFHAASDAETLQLILAEPPTPTRRLRPSVPADLDAICLKCLEKQPGRRYLSAASLAEDLERYLDHQPTVARPVGRIEQGIRWCQRNRLIAALGLLVLLTFATGAVASSLFAVQSSIRARDAEAASLHAIDAQKIAETQQQLAKRSQYFTLINVAQQAWDSGNVARCLEILNDLQSPENGHAIRGFEYYRLFNLCHQNIRTLAGHTQAVMSISQSADGSRLLSGGADGRLLLWQLGEPTRYREITHDLDAAPRSGPEKTTRGVRAVALSPAGNFAASATYSELQIWDLAANRRVHTVATTFGDCFGLAFSPDGALLAAPATSSAIHFWNVQTGEIVSRFEMGFFAGNISALAYSPDGSALAVAVGLPVGEGRVRFWDPIRKTETRAPLRGHNAAILALAFSKDGRRLATGGADQTIKIWDLGTGEVLCTLRGHEGFVTSVQLSDDGTECFSAGADHTVRVWDVDKARLRTTLRGHQDLVTSILVSPVDKKIISASGDATIRIWPEDLRSYEVVPFVSDQANRQTASILVSALATDGDRPYLLTSLSLSADQAHVAAVVVGPDGNGRIEVRNIDDSRDAYSLVDPDRPEQSYACGALSPDGNLFAASTGSYLTTFVLAARRGHPSPKNSDVCIWRTGQSRDLLYRLEGHKHEIFSMAFSPSGDFLATCDTAGEVSLWELSTQRRRIIFAGDREPVVDIRFSANGRYVAAASAYSDLVRVWDLESAEVVEVSTTFPTAVAFSPDGASLAIGSGSFLADRSTAHGEVTIWDWRQRHPGKVLAGHSQFIRRVFYSPDGSQLWSVGFDGAARLWDVESATEITKVDGRFRYALSADLSAAGDRLAIGTESGEACLWDGRHRSPSDEKGAVPRLPAKHPGLTSD